MPTAEPLAISVADFKLVTHDATITITSPKTGDHRTFRIRTVRHGSLEGNRVVELLTGPDNTSDFTGFAFVNKFGEIVVWRKCCGKPGGHPSLFERYADMLESAPFWVAKGVTYEFSLHCRRCGRLLTVPSSIATGYGPECVKKVGV